MSLLVVAATSVLLMITTARGPNKLDSLAAHITLGDVELRHPLAMPGENQSHNKRYQRLGQASYPFLTIQEAIG